MAEQLAWWQKTIAYEAYPKSFQDTKGAGTGTIAGITSRLDHLASLGVGALWLTPMYKSPQKDNGYDVQDYYQIDPSYGTMGDFDELLAQADARGIKIVMDLVFNHTSDENPWFVESSSSRDNAKADWYVWADPKPDGSVPTNWRSCFGGSAWEWCEARQQYYLHTFGTYQPDLNWECPEVRQAIYDVANWWVAKGVGGFRIDAITFIKKPAVFADAEPDAGDGMVDVRSVTGNVPGILDFLHEFKRQVRDGHDIFTVGEANMVAAEELPQWVGRDGVFDMVFGFEHTKVPLGGTEVWYHKVAWKKSTLVRELVKTEDAVAGLGWCPVFFENHDQPRSVDHFLPEAVPAGRTDDAAKALGMLLLTMRGTPFIYQGEELGVCNLHLPSIDLYNDPQSKSTYAEALAAGLSEQEALEAVWGYSRDNARTPMHWDDTANAGFTTGTPWLAVNEQYKTHNVAAESADPDSVLAWYRRLVALRGELPVLVDGDFTELVPGDEQVFGYARKDAETEALVFVNLSPEPTTYDTALVAGAELAASSQGADAQPGALRPYEAVVYRR